MRDGRCCRTASEEIVHQDIESLLAVQADDRTIRELEARLAMLEPRLRVLENERGAVEGRLQGVRQALTGEEQKLADVQRRLGEHRQLHDRSVAQLETVRTQREATAAMSQVEQVKRFVSQDQTMADGIQQRVSELRQAAKAHETTLEELTARQEAERATIADERLAIEEELRLARMKREGAARRVPSALLAKYDRINDKRQDDAVFPLRGPSCGNCDTVLPLQRRSQMQRSGALELCEACGVLLYATE
jgi:uncharacterized protein